MEIENVSWVGLSSGGSSQKEGHLSVGDGLLGQIVVDDKAMLSVVSEEFTDGATGIGSQELKRGGFGSSSGNNNGVSKGIVVFQDFHDVSNGRSLLTNSNVNTVKSLGCISIWVIESSLLVDDSINSNGGLSGLSISNNEFSLTSSNRNLF